jgi:3-oxoacyl-[acyl-carrier protein] reductase
MAPGNRDEPLLNPQAFAGRVALISGVSRRKGIGFAIARRLASQGADLFLHAYSAYDAGQPWGAEQGGVARLAEELRGAGKRVEYQESDLAAPDAPRDLMRAALQTFSRVDILIVNHAHSTMGSLEELTAGQIDRHLAVNVRATLLLLQAFAAQCRADGRGRVVLLTSGQHVAPMPAELAYVAGKGALHQLTLTLAAHLAKHRITVNTVNPGATDTGYASSKLYEQVQALEPQGRWGEPDDAARLIAWLVSDEAQWVTGQVINSTGGGP